MENLKQSALDYQSAVESYVEEAEALVSEMESEIAFEGNKDLYGTWTKDYRDGYVEGANNIINQLKTFLEIK